jgi:hypothetical protein
MIVESVQTLFAKTPKVDQGVIEIQYVRANLYRLRFPDGTEVKIKAGRKAASEAARKWFQDHIKPNEIGIGRIEWWT